ncbi:hypothetical protein RB195_003222 [Necator americanus]|uniref:Uncharacterized protein n=1 Tax=Necator americanus TaxID=51031 RepID=A0ABR1DMM5_NECAM
MVDIKLIVILLAISPLDVCQSVCKNLTRMDGKDLPGNKQTIRCISFKYNVHGHIHHTKDGFNFCDSYGKRMIGTIEKSKWTAADKCILEDEQAICKCSVCDTEEIIRNMPTKDIFNDMSAKISACGNNSDSNWQDPMKHSARNVTTAGGVKTTTLPTTTLDYETTLKPEQKLDDESIKRHTLLIESFRPPYINSIMFSEEDEHEERILHSLTPSILYGSREQERIYESSTIVLMIVNLAAILGITMIFRAVLNATLYVLFPDHALF